MSEDFTKKFSESDRDTILTAIQNLDSHVTRIDSRLQGVETKVDGLEKTVNERLYDTRPIWHKVVDDIGELQAGQKRLEEGQHAMRGETQAMRGETQAMRSDMMDLNTMVRTVNRDQIVLNDAVRRIQLDFHNMDERLFKIIVDRNQQNSQT